MSPKTAKTVLGLGILALSLFCSTLLRAQIAGVTLSGTITNGSGAIVPNAKITVKNLATAQSVETLSDSSGRYTVSTLTPGDYEVSISAEGYSTNTIPVTIPAGAAKTLDVSLKGVLSLGDLGYSPAQIQGSAQDQARLDKRTHMLKIHQRLGLIAAAPLFASVITGTFAGGKATSSGDRTAHLILGSAAADLYFTSAYFAIRAPKIPGTHARGPIRVHKVLAWIHGPGMILTPILGAMAYSQKSRGEKVHGIASAHGAVAIVTAAAFGAAIVSVSFKF